MLGKTALVGLYLLMEHITMVVLILRHLFISLIVNMVLKNQFGIGIMNKAIFMVSVMLKKTISSEITIFLSAHLKVIASTKLR